MIEEAAGEKMPPVVLVIDDESYIRQSIRNFLEDYGYQVVEADSGKTGLAQLRKKVPDIVLLDLRMPHMDGIGVLSAIRELYRDLPVIVVSGAGVVGDVAEALRLGAWDYLFKPIEDFTVLLHSVERALERARMIEERSAYKAHLEELVEKRTDQLQEALQDLREREETYRTLVENLNVGIYRSTADPEGRFLKVNPALVNMFGYESADELMNIPVSSLYGHAPDRDLIVSELKEKGSLRNREIIGKRKDGMRIMCSLTTIAIYENGALKWLDGVVEDITDRKNAETILSKSQDELQRNYETQAVINDILGLLQEDISLDKILQKALDRVLSVRWLSVESRGCIFVADHDSSHLIMSANASVSGELLSKCARVPFGKCLCGRAASTQLPVHADCIDGLHDVIYEGMVPHGHYCIPVLYLGITLGVINLYLKEGHPRDEWEVKFLMSVAHALAGIIKIKRAEDEREVLITELREVLEIVSRSHKEWRATFDSITDLITIQDLSCKIIRVNIATAQYFGLDIREIIGKSCHELFICREDIESCPHRKTTRDGNPVTEEVLDEKTKRIFMVTTFPYFLQSNEVAGTVRIARDVTENRETELRLIMSERLASLGQMAAGIAHEINNPLASIAGCAEGLLSRIRKGKFDPTLFSTYLGIIEEEIQRCKKITTGMLSFVRKSAYDKKQLDINETIEKTIEIMGFQGRLRDVTVRKNLEPNIPSLTGAEGELRQVFLIIMSNALDAMEDRGAITISSRNEEARIIVTITDNGPGIPTDVVSRIFDPFFTTKSEKGGTGLGLSIARKIVSNHNGMIFVSSGETGGAAFTIILPR